MTYGPKESQAAHHLVESITGKIKELYQLFPSQAPNVVEAAVLTVGIHLLIRQAGRERAATVMRNLTKGIEQGRFDQTSVAISQSLH